MVVPPCLPTKSDMYQMNREIMRHLMPSQSKVFYQWPRNSWSSALSALAGRTPPEFGLDLLMGGGPRIHRTDGLIELHV